MAWEEGASDDEGDAPAEGEEVRYETGGRARCRQARRLTPNEIRKRAFEEAKARIQAADAVTAEQRDLRSLGLAVQKCQESLREGNMEALGEAVAKCREALGPPLLGGGDCGDDEGTAAARARAARGRQAWLDSWRPQPARARPAPAEECEGEQGPGRPPSDAACGSSTASAAVGEEGCAVAAAIECKAQADEALRCGEYADAMRIYEALLEDARAAAASGNDGEEVRAERKTRLAALLCNAALCSLKMTADQRGWAQMKAKLRSTVALCDEALAIDGTLAKAHYRRGCALEALERFAEAYRAYQRASVYEPSDSRIREALDRMVCYEEAELGPEVMAEVKERLERLDPTVGRRHGRSIRRSPAASALTACRRCRGDGAAGNFYALPCGHGPFCRDCRARIAREGKELQFCAAPTCGGLISEWHHGPPDVPKVAAGPPPPPARPVFGPPLPPEMRRAARPAAGQVAGIGGGGGTAAFLNALD